MYELTFKTQRPDTVAPDTTHVETLDLGYFIDVPLLKEPASAVGAAVTFYRFDSGLDDVYGSDPISFWVYLRFRFGSAGRHAHHPTRHAVQGGDYSRGSRAMLRLAT